MEKQNQETPRVHVAFVGNSGVGKTRIAMELCDEDLRVCSLSSYPTMRPWGFTFKHNGVIFDIIDSPGSKGYSDVIMNYKILDGGLFIIFHGNENEAKTSDQWENEIRINFPHSTICRLCNASKEGVINCFQDYIGRDDIKDPGYD